MNGSDNKPDDSAEMQPLSNFTYVRNGVTFSERRFKIETLPDDERRVYGHLEEKFGEEYALLFIFTMRTAIELHRAWNMPLLTTNVLQKIKDKFGLRMTWNLGVLRLIFRVEDGSYELHRKVPYDYDSEFQDIYHRIANALVDGQINVHEALVYQQETKEGRHTARSGYYIRTYPGRLFLYPGQAATCAVIFFSGEWIDAGISLLTGLAAGLIEWYLQSLGGRATILLDTLVGIATGAIGGLFFRYSADGSACVEDPMNEAACAAAPCLPAIYLGTLYWFFYGTAFVIGILEIIAGELVTGVTRFVGVAIKTFVLSLGASLGLMFVFFGDTGAANAWHASSCNAEFVSDKWWRTLFYLGNCIFVLGQYRLPITHYWRALLVQLVAYEAQYNVFNNLDQFHVLDNLDTAWSNMVGAAAGAFTALLITLFVDASGDFFRTRLLQHDDCKNSKLGDIYFKFLAALKKATYYFGIGRTSDIVKFQVNEKLKTMQVELKDPNHPREEIILEENEEAALLEAIMGTQDINTWSILMPAVYQLVPGSIIARLWFGSIFPTNPYATGDEDRGTESVFSNLMVISTSLALGLIIGFSIFKVAIYFVGLCFKKSDKECSHQDNFKIDGNYIARKQHDMLDGMYTAAEDQNDDPSMRSLKKMTGSRSLLVEGSDTPLDELETPTSPTTV